MTQDPGLASWLQLTLTPGLGAAALRGLLKQYGLPQQVLARKRSELAALVPAPALAALDSPQVGDAVAHALDWARQSGRHVVTLADEAYPKALLEIADPPALLYAQGRLELLQAPCFAIVGSPETVADKIVEHASEIGCGNMLGLFQLGDMPPEKARENARRYAEEVTPRVNRALPNAAAPLPAAIPFPDRAQGRA